MRAIEAAFGALFFNTAERVAQGHAHRHLRDHHHHNHNHQPSSSSYSGEEPIICGVEEVDEATFDEIEHAKQRWDRAHDETHSRKTEQAQVIDIPVSFHVIHSGNSGRASASTVNEQLRVLNKSFAEFDFPLRELTYHDNATWFSSCYDSDGEYKPAIRRTLAGGSDDEPNVLHIYTCSMEGSERSLLGRARFPWWQQVSPLEDGVIVSYEALPNLFLWAFNQGDIAVHEVGHWLGLFHTFQGGCELGDGVDDTPAQAADSRVSGRGCDPFTDTCPFHPGYDPVNNFMDYTTDSCSEEFTEGQNQRMAFAFDYYRNPNPLFIANDMCSGARALSLGNTIADSTFGATFDLSITVNLDQCPGYSYSWSPGAWFKFQGDGSDVDVVVTSVDIAVRMAVFLGETCNPMTCLGAFETNSTILTTSTTVQTVPGTQYIVRVGGTGGHAAGDFTLGIFGSPSSNPTSSPTLSPTSSPVAATPVCGDEPYKPVGSKLGVLAAGSTLRVSGTTADASSPVSFGSENSTCGTPYDGGPAHWYSLKIKDDVLQDITFSTCDSADFDSKISIFGCAGCLTGLDDTDGCAGSTQKIQQTFAESTTLYILVHGYLGDKGNYNLTISSDVVAPTEAPTVPSQEPSEVPSLFPSDVPSSIPSSGNECGGKCGSCNEFSFAAGCDCIACQDAVCEVDKFCCNTQWDRICASLSNIYCSCMDAEVPSSQPSTGLPSSGPSVAPSATPTREPTLPPTAAPSRSPSSAPTLPPTAAPSGTPSLAPTPTPTKNPSAAPTHSPSASPTKFPTIGPSKGPTYSPTTAPTCQGTCGSGCGFCHLRSRVAGCSSCEHCADTVCDATSPLGLPTCCTVQWTQACANRAKQVCNCCF